MLPRLQRISAACWTMNPNAGCLARVRGLVLNRDSHFRLLEPSSTRCFDVREAGTNLQLGDLTVSVPEPRALRITLIKWPQVPLLDEVLGTIHSGRCRPF